jgi:sugar phosphate isomerase/epimerase
MRLTLHGHLPAPAQDSVPGYTQSPFLSALDSFRDRQAEMVVVVHALESRPESSNTTVEATAGVLARIDEEVRTCAPPVTIALEINRYRGADSPATTNVGLIEIAKRLEGAEIGFCRDFGHARFSFLQEKLPPAPPAEFLSNVYHTHIHGLSTEGQTHWPLSEDCGYLVSDISRLDSYGFDGVYNLELYPTRWAAQQDVRDSIRIDVDNRTQGHADFGDL